MANPENIINSLRARYTRVFEICQEDLTAAEQDVADFLAEEGPTYFSDWFDTATTDISYPDLVAARTAAATLLTTFQSIRSKLQVVRTR